jgi:acyl-CoA thioesterase-1
MKSWLWALWIGLVVLTPPCFADPIEILAMGDSQTNGHGLPQSVAYPAQLEALLRLDGYDVVVKNSGVDGDDSVHIYTRMTQDANERTKIVIYQESGNDISPSGGVEYTEKALAWLKDRQIVTVLISNGRIQSAEDARSLAEEYGAIYYGTFHKGIPDDSEHVQPGEFYGRKNKIDYHLTAAGCALVAKNLEPIVTKIVGDHHLAEPKAATQ